MFFFLVLRKPICQGCSFNSPGIHWPIKVKFLPIPSGFPIWVKPWDGQKFCFHNPDPLHRSKQKKRGTTKFCCRQDWIRHVSCHVSCINYKLIVYDIHQSCQSDWYWNTYGHMDYIEDIRCSTVFQSSRSKCNKESLQ